MYLFAWIVYGAPIWPIAHGLFLLTIVTSAATVGFGMLMASLAKNVETLSAFGTMVVLGMSALGGSMIPRFFMPPWMKKLGLLTINGWAYDGFIDIVRGDGLQAAAPELCVLAGVGIVLASIGAVLLSWRFRSSGATPA